MVELFKGGVVNVPDRASGPLQPPAPIQAEVLVDDHVNTEVEPIAIDVGLALNVSVGAGVGVGSGQYGCTQAGLTEGSGAADNAVPSPAAQPDAVAAGSHQRNTQEKAA